VSFNRFYQAAGGSLPVPCGDRTAERHYLLNRPCREHGRLFLAFSGPIPHILLNMSLKVETRDLAGNPFRIGEWLVEPSLNRISNGDTTTQLELKVMDVFVCLAERAGEVLTRQEIVDRVWATEFISDNTLTHAITEIRNALGDDARNPSFIETIHRRGYRLITSVEPAGSDEAGESKVARFPVPEKPVGSADDRSPYPGLAAFTEADAEFFFGREEEVAKMWRKLTSRRLLAVIGPSGVGKSSFLRAGVIPARPEGWGVLVCQPGERPLAAAARALVPEFSGDDGAISTLVGHLEPDELAAIFGRWRRKHDQALLMVDQFEELFTLNPAETQGRFAGFLRKLVDDCDVHVLLSMRDDFLYRCHGLESIRPIFDGLLPLEQPSAESLGRALTEPAKRLGYAFENDALAEKMVAEVEGERGALPLLAFAISRLWEKRDRERKLLTRQAYNDIGGVGGALARHAESAITSIGPDRLPIVRELFRNLVTAEGTRAVRTWNELLSVFSDSQAASADEVLGELIDVRLLTSYEFRDGDEEPMRSVEVVHESLLTSWPRLVRWQTQDADAAQLRDQLRQAARTWDEHGRTRDFLWTGRAYREFGVWRENYPGGLSELEEAFSSEMASHARRRKRRRRVAAAVVVTIAATVAAVTTLLWQRSVREARRAEAAKLLAIAQVQVDTDPTEALAFATASIELADSHEARVFTARALSAGPPLRALVLADYGIGGSFREPLFSPDGQWVSLAGFNNEFVVVWNQAMGEPIVLGGHTVSGYNSHQCGWTRDGYLVTGHWTSGRVRIWEIPTGRLVRTIEIVEPSIWWVGNRHLLADTGRTFTRQNSRSILHRWKLPDGPAEDLGFLDLGLGRGASSAVVDPDGNAVYFAQGDAVFRCGLPLRREVPGTLLARHSSDGITFDYRGLGWFFSRARNGEIIQWTSNEGMAHPVRRLHEPENADSILRPDSSGRWAIDPREVIGQRDGKRLLWDLDTLLGAKPIELCRSGGWTYVMADFHPAADWVVSATKNGLEFSFWPLRHAFPAVIDGYDTFSRLTVGFTPDGQFLVSNWDQDRVRLWALPGSGGSEIIDLRLPQRSSVRSRFAVSPKGDRILSPGRGADTFLLSRSGEDPVQLSGFPDLDLILGGAFSPSGSLVAAAALYADGQPTLRVWDVQDGESQVFDVPKGELGTVAESPYQNHEVENVVFADESTLYTSGSAGLLRWDLEGGSFEQIIKPAPNNNLFMRASADGRKILTFEAGEPFARQETLLHDLVTGEARQIDIPTETTELRLGPSGDTWVAGEENGLIWVGRFDGGEPHLLAGHDGPIRSISISPDQKWVASSGEDSTLRLWPMPDLSKPPLHTLPHDELIAKLKTLTNLRVVRDEESSTGWKVEVGPFPGWGTVPEW